MLSLEISEQRDLKNVYSLEGMTVTRVTSGVSGLTDLEVERNLISRRNQQMILRAAIGGTDAELRSVVQEILCELAGVSGEEA